MKLRHFSLIFLFAVTSLFTMNSTAQVAQSLAPSGKIKASINLGNPILANKDPQSGLPTGVSVDLAKALAKKLGLELELVVFDSAGESVQAVKEERADFGFFAVDPVRGEGIAFTDPYVLIEGSYLVRNDSPLHANEEVDKEGIRVTVGKGSAYDLFLTRELKHATLVRSPTSPTVVDYFMDNQIEVAAGVKQQLEFDQKRFNNLRLLPGRFMVIQQAMGIPKSRSAQAHQYLIEFVKEMKSSGMVVQSLKNHQIEGASVAP
jgi:polar amino acid transport system substrate-binding protein